jgi:hypothetical protein
MFTSKVSLHCHVVPLAFLTFLVSTPASIGGLFAFKNFPKGSQVASYSGKIVPASELGTVSMLFHGLVRL